VRACCTGSTGVDWAGSSGNSIFLVLATHHDPERIIRQWSLQSHRFIPTAYQSYC
jgi:hypothetical protein